MTTSLGQEAKDGNINAIEELMNKAFSSRGVQVKVAKSGSVLKILLTSSELPNRQLSDAVKKGLVNISPRGFDKVFLKAESSETNSSWTEQWKLEKQPSLAANSLPNQENKMEVKAQDSANKPKSFQIEGIDNPGQAVAGVISLAVFGALSWFYFGGGLSWWSGQELNKIQDQVAQDQVQQYNIAKQSGNPIDICVQAGMVAAAYLQAQDQTQYAQWKEIERTDCRAAGIDK